MIVTRVVEVDWGIAGIASTLGVSVKDWNGVILIARTTSGITEFPAASGVYIRTFTSWNTDWSGQIFWDDGQVGVDHQAIESFDIDEVGAGAGGGGGGGVAVGLYADESDLDDLRGIDTITSWSDLENTKTRNSSRIQRAFNQTDAFLQKELERVYLFPLTNLSAVDSQILEMWSSVLAAYQLYTHRGVTTNATTGRQVNPYAQEVKEILDNIWLYQNNKRTLDGNKRPNSSTRVALGSDSRVQILLSLYQCRSFLPW